METFPLERFAALEAQPGFRHAFVGRIPGIDVAEEREVVLARLAEDHRDARAGLGLGTRVFVTGEQVHGREVAVVDADTKGPVNGVDGVITADPRVCLGVYVADCCAVYLVEPERRVAALLHSGRKGSELGVTAHAIARMCDDFGCDPAKIVAQLSPCIRPPHFEIDFAALIAEQCRAAGVTQVIDCGTSTAQNLERYYSYRVERGKTGRMLALLALAS